MNENVVVDSPGGAKGKFSFWMQIGLTREQINAEGELTLASLKEAACSFVDRKVSCFVCRFREPSISVEIAFRVTVDTPCSPIENMLGPPNNI